MPVLPCLNLVFEQPCLTNSTWVNEARQLQALCASLVSVPEQAGFHIALRLWGKLLFLPNSKRIHKQFLNCSRRLTEPQQFLLADAITEEVPHPRWPGFVHSEVIPELPSRIKPTALFKLLSATFSDFRDRCALCQNVSSQILNGIERATSSQQGTNEAATLVEAFLSILEHPLWSPKLQ